MTQLLRAITAHLKIVSTYIGLISDPTPAHLLDRYDSMLAPLAPEAINKGGEDENDPAHLRWMIAQLRSPMEPLQASRWLGWVQKAICDLGLTTSMIERDFTRPHFKPMRDAWPALRDSLGLAGPSAPIDRS